MQSRWMFLFAGLAVGACQDKCGGCNEAGKESAPELSQRSPNVAQNDAWPGEPCLGEPPSGVETLASGLFAKVVSPGESTAPQKVVVSVCQASNGAEPKWVSLGELPLNMLRVIPKLLEMPAANRNGSVVHVWMDNSFEDRPSQIPAGRTNIKLLFGASAQAPVAEGVVPMAEPAPPVAELSLTSPKDAQTHAHGIRSVSIKEGKGGSLGKTAYVLAALINGRTLQIPPPGAPVTVAELSNELADIIRKLSAGETRRFWIPAEHVKGLIPQVKSAIVIDLVAE